MARTKKWNCTLKKIVPPPNQHRLRNNYKQTRNSAPPSYSRFKEGLRRLQLQRNNKRSSRQRHITVNHQITIKRDEKILELGQLPNSLAEQA